MIYTENSVEESGAENVRYLSCLTIAPVFFAAAVYLCLSRIVVVYGAEYSRFRPRTYTVLFMSCDFISLVLQAAGGAIADTNLADLPMQATGVHVMVAGLAFQVASLSLFATLCIEYAWRVKQQKGPRMTEYIHISNRKRFHIFLCCKSKPFHFGIPKQKPTLHSTCVCYALHNSPILFSTGRTRRRVH